MAAQQTFAFFQSDDVATSRAAGKKNAVRKKDAAAKKSPAAQKDAAVQKNTAARKNTALPKLATNSKPTEPFKPQPAVQAPPAEDTPLDRDTILARLRTRAGCVSLAPADDRPKLSTGCAALDQLLPSGGLKIDALTEWVGETDSSGASTMSLITAANQLRSTSLPLVVVDHDQQFYPPAAVALGIPAERMILVRPESRGDLIWSIDQALRCESVGAVWAPVGAWLKDHDARRFQLAAEIGNTPGLLVRPAAVRGRPSFAEVRFHVNVQKTNMQARGAKVFESQQPTNQLYDLPFFAAEVTIDRCRGDGIGKHLWIQIDDQARLRPIAPRRPAKQLDNLPTSQPLEVAAHNETAFNYETAAVHLADQLANPTPAKQARERRA